MYKKQLIEISENGDNKLLLVNANEIKLGGAWYSQWSKEYIKEEDEYERNTLSSSFYRDGEITFQEDIPKGEFHYYDENSDGMESTTADDFSFDEEFFCYHDGSNHRAIGICDNETIEMEKLAEYEFKNSKAILYKTTKNEYLLDEWGFYEGDQGDVTKLNKEQIKQLNKTIDDISTRVNNIDFN
jgi:hypothetical protein